MSGLVGRIVEDWVREDAGTRARWARWEKMHGGFAEPEKGKTYDTVKLRDKLINLPGGKSTGYATKDGYHMKPFYAPAAGKHWATHKGSTIYGYDIHAPSGEKLSGVAGLRNRTTQSVIDKHRKAHAPTAEAGATIEKIESNYGTPKVMPTGDGAALVHISNEGGDRFWHVSPDGVPMPVHSVDDAAKHVPIIEKLLAK